MKPRQARLDEIVLKAAALDTQERTAYLGRLVEEAPGLLEDARRLLVAAAEVSDTFLADPALQILGDETRVEGSAGSVEETPVSPEERYTLGPRLGRGGMAEVFRAHDHQLDRSVAFKLLHSRDPVNLSHCLREARIQARVRHRHVLDVYDTGEWQGRPFIALRFVDGLTLDEAAESSSLEQQVALLIQAAEGLDAAHGIGLIHRDVKPSNVLVEEADGEMTAFVSDFGIATPAVEEEGRPDVSGTVPYLAPERLDPNARPDRRCDIWSLGVMMYELFTGALPFQGPLLLDQLHRIRQHEPVPPRARVPSLPVDLEAVVLKCLAKDPTERYSTSREVAADLKRWLDGDVVEAYAAGLAYRITRFGLRHRGWVLFAAIAAGLLTVALAVAAVLGNQAMRAEHREWIRRGQAEDLINFMLLDLRDKLDGLGRLELIDEVGSKAMGYFAAVPASDLSNEELSRYSTALHQLGEVRMRQGDLSTAVEAFEQSLELAETALEREPHNQEHVFGLGQSYFWVGYGRRELGQLDLAQEAFEAYLDLSERWVAADPESPRRLLELSYAHGNLGTLHEDRGELEAAEERFESSLRIKERLADADPEDQALQDELAWAHNALGGVRWSLGRPTVRDHFSTELEIRRRLVEAAPRDARWQDHLATTHNYLGTWLLQYGSWPDAEEHYLRADDLYTALVDGDPDNYQRRRRRAINRIGLGCALLALGDVNGSLRLLEAVRETFDRALEPDSLDRRATASALIQLARAQIVNGRLDEAVGLTEQAVGILERLTADSLDDPMTLRRWGTAWVLRGDLHQKRSQEVEARQAWRRAVEILEPLAANSKDRRVWAPLISARLRLGRLEEVEPWLTTLRAEGFCDPSFPELCAPQLVGRGGRTDPPSTPLED